MKTLPAPDPEIGRMVSAFQEKRDGIYESVKKSILGFDFSPWFGAITKLEPVPSDPWEITKVKAKITGMAFFSMQSEKYQGMVRISWERYPNGAYFAQVIDDADGFELFNRVPSIYPPEIEMEPGTYRWRTGTFRGMVLTLTETDMALDYVDSAGFILWEQQFRYQMVGKQIHAIKPLKRFREKTLCGYAFGAWRQLPDLGYRLRKISESEFEIIVQGKRRRFIRESLVKGSRSYAYKTGERIKGRILRDTARKAPIR